MELKQAATLCSLCLLCSVHAQQTVYQRPINQDCVTPSTQSTDITNYFPDDLLVVGEAFQSPDHVTVSFAQGFQVQYFSSYKVVTNSIANETYVLYQCGLPPPAIESFPAGAKLFAIPLDSVAVLETVPLAFMTALGVNSRMQSVSEYAVGACGQKLLTCPDKAAPSLDTAPANSTALLQPLQAVADAVVTSSEYSIAQTFAFSASMDPGVLSRAEWMKFLGLFFNMDAESSEIFAAINESYYQTVADVEAREQDGEPPVLAFVDMLDYDPDHAYEVSFAPYKLQYTEAAGAVAPDFDIVAAIPNVVHSTFETTPNSTLQFAWGAAAGSFDSQEEALAAFQQFLTTVDIVVDETYALDPTTYDLAAFAAMYNITDNATFPFMRNAQVYREDGLIGPAPSYGLDWFEGAIARPDLVLSDFAAAVTPSQYLGRRPTWIRNVARGDKPTITTAQNCNAITSCTQQPTPICPYVRACPDGSIAQQVAANTTCVYSSCSS